MGTSDLRLEGVDLWEAVAFGGTGVAEAVVRDPCGVVAAVEDAHDEVLGEAFGRVVVARSRLDAVVSDDSVEPRTSVADVVLELHQVHRVAEAKAVELRRHRRLGGGAALGGTPGGLESGVCVGRPCKSRRRSAAQSRGCRGHRGCTRDTGHSGRYRQSPARLS
eukprot:scaffold56708_cov103-Phaeocystis_antarctica.AAC.1